MSFNPDPRAMMERIRGMMPQGMSPRPAGPPLMPMPMNPGYGGVAPPHMSRGPQQQPWGQHLNPSGSFFDYSPGVPMNPGAGGTMPGYYPPGQGGMYPQMLQDFQMASQGYGQGQPQQPQPAMRSSSSGATYNINYNFGTPQQQQSSQILDREAQRRTQRRNSTSRNMGASPRRGQAAPRQTQTFPNRDRMNHLW